MELNNIKVALWDNDKATHEKSPILRGKLTDENGNVIGEISLWKGEKYEKGGKFPRLTGKIQPPYKTEDKTSKPSVKGDF